jgi:hypothetical protein
MVYRKANGEKNVRLSREGAVGGYKYVLDAEMLFLEKAPNLLAIGFQER